MANIKLMKKYTYSLSDSYIELIKLLKVLGIAENGAHAKQIVEQGKVKVNNTTEFRKRCKIKSGYNITMNDIRIDIE